MPISIAPTILRNQIEDILESRSSCPSLLNILCFDPRASVSTTRKKKRTGVWTLLKGRPHTVVRTPRCLSPSTRPPPRSGRCIETAGPPPARFDSRRLALTPACLEMVSCSILRFFQLAKMPWRGRRKNGGNSENEAGLTHSRPIETLAGRSTRQKFRPPPLRNVTVDGRSVAGGCRSTGLHLNRTDVLADNRLLSDS